MSITRKRKTASQNLIKNKGYTGPRCSVCKPGYGRTGLACDKCQDSSLNWFLIVLIVIAALAVVYLLVSSSIAAGHEEEVDDGDPDVPSTKGVTTAHLNLPPEEKGT